MEYLFCITFLFSIVRTITTLKIFKSSLGLVFETLSLKHIVFQCFDIAILWGSWLYQIHFWFYTFRITEFM